MPSLLDEEEPSIYHGLFCGVCLCALILGKLYVLQEGVTGIPLIGYLCPGAVIGRDVEGSALRQRAHFCAGSGGLFINLHRV